MSSLLIRHGDARRLVDFRVTLITHEGEAIKERGVAMTEARLARDYDIRFGHGLLMSDSANWGRYVVITTPSAWAATKDELDHEPAGIGYNEWLDRTHLIEVSDSLPG